MTLATDAHTSLAPALVDPGSHIGEAMAGAGSKVLADRPGVAKRAIQLRCGQL